MPFASDRQRRFLFARKSEIARQFVEEARRSNKRITDLRKKDPSNPATRILRDMAKKSARKSLKY